MLRAAITFFVFGIIFLLLGLGGIAGVTIEIGRMLLYVFLILSLVAFVINLINGGRRGPRSVRPLLLLLIILGASLSTLLFFNPVANAGLMFMFN